MTDKPEWMTRVADQAGAEAPVPGVVAPPINPKLTLHVDGDYLAYYCSGNDETDAARARQNVLDKLESGRVMSGSGKVVVHLTMSGSHKGHRYQAATVKPYQAQRSSSRRPKNWEFLREYLETYDGDAFTIKLWRDREADDGIAFAAENALALYGTPLVVIYTRDKDMRMLPGLHLDWMTYQLTEVPPGAYAIHRSPDGLLYGLKWFWQQMLQGDTADNIPGLPKLDGKLCGEVRARSALAGTESVLDAFDVVSQGYIQHYGEEWADRLVEQAALLWLRRDREASVTNYLGFLPGLGHPNVAEVAQASIRLNERIKESNATLDTIYRNAFSSEDAG